MGADICRPLKGNWSLCDTKRGGEGKGEGGREGGERGVTCYIFPTLWQETVALWHKYSKNKVVYACHDSFVWKKNIISINMISKMLPLCYICNMECLMWVRHDSFIDVGRKSVTLRYIQVIWSNWIKKRKAKKKFMWVRHDSIIDVGGKSHVVIHTSDME